MRPSLTTLPGLLLLACASAAHAQATPPATPSELLRVRALAATCANCHGTEGRAVPGSVVPGLAGQPAAALSAALLAYQRGERQATVMHQITKGYTAAQIDTLAQYFASLKP